MKSLIVFSMLIVQSQVFAADSIKLEVFPKAQVIEVKCHSLVHLGHDTSLAGTAKIRTEENQIVDLRMTVSRFTDEGPEASALCSELKAAKKSKSTLDVIVERVQNIEDSGNAAGDDLFDVKGVKSLHGLNPLHNG